MVVRTLVSCALAFALATCGGSSKVCTPDTLRCQGNDVERCESSGADWEFYKTCGAGQTCVDGTCGSTANCNNGTCDPDENCSICPGDCPCTGSQVCVSGQCQLPSQDAGAQDSGGQQDTGGGQQDVGCSPYSGQWAQTHFRTSVSGTCYPAVTVDCSGNFGLTCHGYTFAVHIDGAGTVTGTVTSTMANYTLAGTCASTAFCSGTWTYLCDTVNQCTWDMTK